MLPHIVAHSEQVGRVALALVDHMNGSTATPDRNMVLAAALLHDITKTRSFETGEDHAQTGARFLTERGYPDVGKIVGQHVRLDTYFKEGAPDEAEIINYADKRVLHDRVVSLESRMAYIVERYGGEPDLNAKLKWLSNQSRMLEDRLFSHIDFVPADLTQHIVP